MNASSETRAIARHESAHAAAFLLLNWPPLLARCDRPGTLAGHVKPDYERRDISRESMRDQLIAILAGAAHERQLQDAWPIDPDEWEPEHRKDAEQAQYISDWLGLDAVAWHGAIFKVEKLVNSRQFKTLAFAITDRLADVELLFRDELVQIAEEVKT